MAVKVTLRSLHPWLPGARLGRADVRARWGACSGAWRDCCSRAHRAHTLPLQNNPLFGSGQCLPWDRALQPVPGSVYSGTRRGDVQVCGTSWISYPAAGPARGQVKCCLALTILRLSTREDVKNFHKAHSCPSRGQQPRQGGRGLGARWKQRVGRTVKPPRPSPAPTPLLPLIPTPRFCSGRPGCSLHLERAVPRAASTLRPGHAHLGVPCHRLSAETLLDWQDAEWRRVSGSAL